MRAAVAAALIAVLAAAGCSGGGPSREEFVEKANANCKQRQQAELAIADQSAEEFADDPDAVWRVYDRESAKQRKLEPPDELADDWQRYLRLFDESTKNYRVARDLEAPSDTRSAAEVKAGKAGVQARNIAEKMGLDVCGDAFY